MQNYRVEDVNGISKKIFFEIPYEEFSKELENTLASISKTASLKGFRKGKAPKEFIRKTYGDSIKEEVTEKIININYSQAIKNDNIKTVSYPVISSLKINENGPITFEALIEVLPSVEVNESEFRGLKIDAINANVKEEEIDETIKSFLESRAQTKTVEADRAVVKGDYVNVDLIGFIDGVEKEDLKAISYITNIGTDKGLLKDLDEAILGMKPNEEKKVTVIFPEDYHSKDYASKEVLFNVKLNSLQERVVPELSDELLKEVFKNSPKIQNKEDYLTLLRENLKTNKENEKQTDIRVKISELLLKDRNFDVPNAEIERKVPEIRERAIKNTFGYYANAPEYKVEIDNFLKENEEGFKKVSINELKLSYILRAIAKQQNFSATNEEIEAELLKTAKALNMTLDKFKVDYSESLAREVIELSILEQKAFKFVIDEAIITEIV